MALTEGGVPLKSVTRAVGWHASASPAAWGPRPTDASGRQHIHDRSDVDPRAWLTAEGTQRRRPHAVHYPREPGARDGAESSTVQRTEYTPHTSL